MPQSGYRFVKDHNPTQKKCPVGATLIINKNKVAYLRHAFPHTNIFSTKRLCRWHIIHPLIPSNKELKTNELKFKFVFLNSFFRYLQTQKESLTTKNEEKMFELIKNQLSDTQYGVAFLRAFNFY